ncbi:hypothetical protein K474DRAFT_1693669 [Panus rudis PR-1116 ss-1]|nr:hypothetical protein K474DRAFT_1693669 [Panus rudis PR-1116 ss-1]
MTARGATFPRSSLLVLGSNGVYSLLPSTLISQIEALLDAHRIEDAVDMADKHRQKVQAQLTVSDDEADELRYVYQRIGFQCLTETLFDDAGRHLFDGELDPRALISYYPELYGSLYKEDDAVELFSGVAERMPPEGSIEEIIAANLVRNYSPHLAPSTRLASPTVELRGILKLAASDMLKAFLRKWRRKRRMDDPGGSPETKSILEVIFSLSQSYVSSWLILSKIVETVLVKLHVDAEEKEEIYKLVNEPNEINVEEIEPELIESHYINALCQLYRQRGEDSKLLETWSRLVTGELTDSEVQDPLSSMFAFLGDKRDRHLVYHWGVWLTQYDPERALKLLTTFSSRRGTKQEDDLALLKQLQEANPSVGVQFLEFLVLQKRSNNANLHQQLADMYTDQLVSCLSDESISKLWRAKTSSYTSSRSEVPFLSYFASTTPDSDSKRIRLKAILFLQGSDSYDPESVRQRLAEHEKMLALELAIVEGKCLQDRSALSHLVHFLHDSASAEAYCALGGEVVPVKTAQNLGERFGLQPWSALFLPPGAAGKAKAGSAPVVVKRERSLNEDRKKELTRILLEVYMSGGEAMADRTAKLLSAQAINLDVTDVISLIPPEWPLKVLSNFLERSFRRTLHAKHEGQIIKAIAQSENLAVAEKTWLVIREQGAIIEEPVDDDDDVGGGSLDEKGEKPEGLGLELDEKAAINPVSAT